MFTFWSYLRNRWPRDAGLRLDHLLLGPAIAPRLKAAGVDREVRGERDASDHAPALTRLGAAARPVENHDDGECQGSPIEWLRTGPPHRPVIVELCHVN
jgi:hypothetical protein